jgi:hypothetical protein
MKAEFTNRAVGDLRKISAQSRKEFGDWVAAGRPDPGLRAI